MSRGHAKTALAARLALTIVVALSCLFVGVQLALRWESTAFEAVGAVNLISGQSFSGRITMDWSGDLVVSSTSDEEGQPPVAVAISSLRTLTFTQGPSSGAPWRLMVGLLLAVVGAGAVGWAAFMSKRWMRRGY